MKTISLKKSEISKKWWVVDAEGQILGRFASKIAQILRGKHKPNFTPHMDMGDFVIVINADKIKLSGNKLENKEYFRHTNFPGGARFTSMKQAKDDKPEFILHNSVKGMPPHNRLGRAILKHLKIYAGNEHPHKSQNPERLEF